MRSLCCGSSPEGKALSALQWLKTKTQNGNQFMLTQDGCLARRQRLWNALPSHVEWVLVADPRHVQYLANFWVQPLSFAGGERGLLLLERDGTASLLGDNFALRCAVHDPYIDREILEPWYDHQHSVINRDHALVNAVKKVAGSLKGRAGVVEAEWLPLAMFQEIGETLAGDDGEPLHLGSILRDLRREKELDEVTLLKQCMKAGDAGQARAREFVKPGVSEFDVYREVQQAAIATAGRPGLVYGDFRATNAQNPKVGGLSTDYILQEGDLFILDYSVVLDGYRSDFTNTIAVGTPSAEQRSLFDHCLAAMQAAESTLKAGTEAKAVYAAATEKLEKAGHGPLGHHAGHGLGLAHPEPPILVPDSTDTLRAGDVVTIEPGQYVEGIGGIRIEHNYLITDDGYERLSNHTISLD